MSNFAEHPLSVAITTVHVRQPKITAAFDVDVDPEALRISGAELPRFLRVTAGVPEFDIESDGQRHNRCRLRGEPSDDGICFTCEETTSVEPEKESRRNSGWF